MEKSEDQQDRSGGANSFHNEFYTAILKEDLGCIETMSKRYGSNCHINIQNVARGEACSKGFAILPLHLAASYRRVKSMQTLLSAGADPEMRDQLGRTTLHLIITSWPRVRTTRTKPALVGSVCGQAEHCLRLLCEHGVDINAETERESHQTALHLSVRYEALSAIHILASYGAEVNAVDSSGMTPLHMAAGILHKDILASLIKEGADINKRVKHSGNTPLHLATVAMAMKTSKTLVNDSSCISGLLEQGAEVNSANNAGLTPIQEACSMGNEELVDLLLRYRADINMLSRAGESCLFLFLNHRPNVRNSSLLVKLYNLTSPLTVYNSKGHLPLTLTLPCYCKQRDQLLTLTQQTRRLQDICKKDIYLQHVRDQRENLRNILPEKLYDFVFNYWQDLQVSFVTDDELDLYNASFNAAYI